MMSNSAKSQLRIYFFNHKYHHDNKHCSMVRKKTGDFDIVFIGVKSIFVFFFLYNTCNVTKNYRMYKTLVLSRNFVNIYFKCQ